jgi:hypothetical protein
MATASAEDERLSVSLGILSFVRSGSHPERGTIKQAKSLKVATMWPKDSPQGKQRRGGGRGRADPRTILGANAGNVFKAALASAHVQLLLSDDSNDALTHLRTRGLMIHDGEPALHACLSTLNRPSFPGSRNSILTLLRSASYYSGRDAKDKRAQDEDLWVIQRWWEGMKEVCIRHNVCWRDFVDRFSEHWIEPHALEIELLSVLDREGSASYTNATVIKAQGCLFKEFRQKACLMQLRLGLECHGDATPEEIAPWVATAPPRNWGRPLSQHECEAGRRLAVEFDAERCRRLAELQTIVPYTPTVEVWNAGTLGPRHVMTFSTSCVGIVAIARLTSSPHTTREEALEQPLLGHLVVATEMTRDQQFRSTNLFVYGENNPFFRYLTSGRQGVVSRLRCRYTATTEAGGVL